jgi:hypothetical protein
VHELVDHDNGTHVSGSAQQQEPSMIRRVWLAWPSNNLTCYSMRQHALARCAVIGCGYRWGSIATFNISVEQQKEKAAFSFGAPTYSRAAGNLLVPSLHFLLQFGTGGSDGRIACAAVLQ